MAALNFLTRESCISCGGKMAVPVWSTSYANGRVQHFMDAFHYATDWRAELGDLPIALVCCPDCNMMYHQHVLDAESLEQLYSEWIDENQISALTNGLEDAAGPAAMFRDASDNVRHLLRLNRLLHADQTSSTNGGSGATPLRVLDFGCGAGAFLQQASLFGFDTWGVDFSTTRAAQAKDNQVTIVATLDEFRDEAEQPMHAVTLFQVLEHLDDPRQTLLELAKVLTHDGVLIIEVPNCGRVSVPKNFDEFRCVHPLEHINAFTPQTLTSLVESAGFAKINPGPAHVTSRPDALVRSELTRFYEPKRTNQYFRKS